MNEDIDTSPWPLAAAADLQDNLLMAGNDLERLGTLLDDCHAQLSSGFFGTLEQLQALRQRVPASASGSALSEALDGVLAQLARTVKALQFQDMSTQLIGHTQHRLRHCVDQLARQTFGADEDGETVVEAAPLRPNPVTQSEMDTGFIELF